MSYIGEKALSLILLFKPFLDCKVISDAFFSTKTGVFSVGGVIVVANASISFPDTIFSFSSVSATITLSCVVLSETQSPDTVPSSIMVSNEGVIR